MKVLNNLVWSGKMVMLGCGVFEPNRTEEKSKEVTRNRDPALERGTAPGEEG
jgi:hypothetical protein